MGDRERFDQWVILEVMGHRRLAGRLTEAEIGGGVLLRIDMPQADGTEITQYYGPSAVFCITPTTEESARALATTPPRPVQPWELRQLRGAEDGAEPTLCAPWLDDDGDMYDEDGDAT